MPESKQTNLSNAIARFAPDGASIAMGTSLETSIPFAAGRELIRQERRGLTLIGPISDILFDQIIGAGCVGKVRAAWVGNVITGSGYNFRRAVERNLIKVEDHSNLTIAMGLKAGAMGVPFMPVRTALGSDLLKNNPALKVFTCPFTGKTLVGVAAIKPDTAIIQVQRSDEAGNAHAWGNHGVTKDACLAAEHIVLMAEEIVSSEIIRSDPNRVICPGFRASAVVHAPWGGHPSPVPGCYNRDHQAFIDYRNMSKTEDGFRKWRKLWVDGLALPEDYMGRLGKKRMDELSIKRHLYSAPVDYGY